MCSAERFAGIEPELVDEPSSHGQIDLHSRRLLPGRSEGGNQVRMKRLVEGLDRRHHAQGRQHALGPTERQRQISRSSAGLHELGVQRREDSQRRYVKA